MGSVVLPLEHRSTLHVAVMEKAVVHVLMAVDWLSTQLFSLYLFVFVSLTPSLKKISYKN